MKDIHSERLITSENFSKLIKRKRATILHKEVIRKICSTTLGMECSDFSYNYDSI